MTHSFINPQSYHGANPRKGFWTQFRCDSCGDSWDQVAAKRRSSAAVWKYTFVVKAPAPEFRAVEYQCGQCHYRQEITGVNLTPIMGRGDL